MKIKSLHIRNYRGIKSLDLDLDDLTILIGENNAGKSTVIEALRVILTRGMSPKRSRVLTEYDFHLADEKATPQSASDVSISLHFMEEEEDDWPEAVVQQLGDVVLPDDEGKNSIHMRLVGTLEPASGAIETKWSFLNSDGNELPKKQYNPIPALLRLVPLFFLSALRDASQEFGSRGQFWSGFVKSIQLPDDEREKLEAALRGLNEKLISANSSLGDVVDKLKESNQLVELFSTDPVALEALPTRLLDTIGKLEVHVKSQSGAKLPLNRHGEGTQNLAVLKLFQAFTAVNLKELYEEESTPVLALEEPEAHLHPSAIRGLGQLLGDLAGQVVVSSHSGDLVSRVPITSLRRLYKRGEETLVGHLRPETLTETEVRHLDYNIRQSRGSYLFARCWLLVEGKTEYWLLPLIAEYLGKGPDSWNYSVIEYSQHGGPTPFVKTAYALGVGWFMVTDGDQAGNEYKADAETLLINGEMPIQRIHQLGHRDIEHLLWESGFSQVYKDALTPQQETQILGNHAVGTDGYKTATIKGAIKTLSKPELALLVMVEIENQGRGSIPQAIIEIIDKTCALTRGTP